MTNNRVSEKKSNNTKEREWRKSIFSLSLPLWKKKLLVKGKSNIRAAAKCTHTYIAKCAKIVWKESLNGKVYVRNEMAKLFWILENCYICLNSSEVSISYPHRFISPVMELHQAVKSYCSEGKKRESWFYTKICKLCFFNA